jgi:hypothetical protein
MELEYVEADSFLEGKYDRILYDKFVEAYDINNYEVLTPTGYVNIEGIGKTVEFEEYKLMTSGGRDLTCADNHIMYVCTDIDFVSTKCVMTETYCKNVTLGDFIMTDDGPEMVMELYQTGNKSHMYDLQLSEGSNKQYYTNGILSHNSLWMQNFAVGSADAGYNVLYITLEMTERKVMKRLGSMRLKIPINEFDTISKDTDFMRKKIEAHKKVKNAGIGDGLFSKEKGKIITKFWAAGTATISDFDAYIARLQDRRNIKIDLIIVDYISLIAVPKSIGGDSLYIKGKLLAEGLRSLASKYNAGVVTAVQLAKGAWNSSDITLESVPESKAIPETADSVWAIIRTDDMKRQNIYRLKLLKQRDGDFSKSQIMFNLNTQYLNLEDDRFIDGV